MFCGAGGLSTGLKLSKHFEPVVAVECDEFAANTYAKNFPNADVIQAKIENITAKEILARARSKGYRKIDAICGGPPCRPFSKSNKGATQWKIVKKTQNISRHPDWTNFLRLIKQLSPKFVVAENVMGFRTNRDVFAPFVSKLEKMGYTVVSPLLNAVNFGVAQRRERIIIIAIKGKVSKNHMVPNGSDNLVTVKDMIFDLPSLSNKQNGMQEMQYVPKKSKHNSAKRKTSKILFNHQAHSVHPVMKTRFEYIPQGYNLKQAWEHNKMPKKIACSSYFQLGRIRKYTLKAIKEMHSNIYRRLSWNDAAPTLTNAKKTVILHPRQHRILSVRECAKLQSFPDHFVFSGSLSQQYQQVADAVPPLLAKAVGSRIVAAFTNCQKPRNTTKR